MPQFSFNTKLHLKNTLVKNLRNHLDRIISSAIASVTPKTIISRKVKLHDDFLVVGSRKFDLKNVENIFVVGAGKASAFMAFEIEKILGDRVTGGAVSTKYGHSAESKRIKILEAGHPLLDTNTLKATSQILEISNRANENDLVICLISGGGSSLLEKLPDQISLTDLQKVNRHLLECGAAINEINTIRKKLSLVKGGKLLRSIYPASCLSLIISDVIGDRIDMIASGPTCLEKLSADESLNIIAKYNLTDRLPKNVLEYLNQAEDSIKTMSDFASCENIILAANRDAIEAARQQASSFGYNIYVINEPLTGEARVRGKELAKLVFEIYDANIPVQRPACVIAGGETTVTIRGKGTGGRNQELTLAALIEMKNFARPFLIASFGTDGTDGPTDAAGGVIDQNTWRGTIKQNLNPLQSLSNNDSYNLLSKVNGLIKTGPTGTNVADILLCLIP